LPSQNRIIDDVEAKLQYKNKYEVKKSTEGEIELIRHIAGHFDELTTSHIGMFQNELLELSGSTDADFENLLIHFPCALCLSFSLLL
jgi:hypothetical protein